MAYTLNRRLAQLVDSNGQLNTGKIPNDYITSDHVADNTITASMLHTSFTVSSSNLSSIDTSAVSEGTNLYYTDARADARIAAATTSDLSEGGNLYYTDARVASYISGNRTYGNITTTGYIAGPSTFTIDPAAVGDNTGTVVIAGNLQVDGTTTTINSTTVNIDDLNIQLATGAANAAAADGAGITVDGSNAELIYQASNDRWKFNKVLKLTTPQSTTASLTLEETSGSSLQLTARGSTATIGTTTNHPLHFYVNNASKANLTNNGDLTVVNDLKLTTTNPRIDYDNNGSGALRFYSMSAAQERARITSAGKMIIGDVNTDTTDALQIQSPATGGGYGIQIRRDDSNTDQQMGRILFGNNTNNDLAQIASKTDGSTDNSAIFFSTRSSGNSLEERVRIDSDGNLGIGDTQPSFKLDVNNTGSRVRFKATTGHSNIELSSVAGRDYLLQSLSTGNFVLHDEDANTNRLIIDTAGGFNPTGVLYLGSDHLGSTPSDGVIAAAYASGYNNAGGNLQLYGGRSTGDNPGGEIQFFTGPAGSAGTQINSHVKRMIIDSSGNVGIGTSSPSGITNSKVLEIKNTSTGTGTHAQITLTGSNGHTNLLLASGDDTNGGDPVISSTTNHAIRFGHSTNSTFSGFDEHMRIADDGNVGIGTDNPGQNLEIRDDNPSGNTGIRIHNNSTSHAAILELRGGRTSANDSGQIVFNNSGNIVARIDAKSGGDEGQLRFYTSAVGTGDAVVQAMHIDTGGNVGIGTDNPGQKFHVDSGSTNVVARFESTDAIAAIQLKDSTGNVELETYGGAFRVNPGGSSNPLSFSSSATSNYFTTTTSHSGTNQDFDFTILNNSNSNHGPRVRIYGGGQSSAAASDVPWDNQQGYNTSSLWFDSGEGPSIYGAGIAGYAEEDFNGNDTPAALAFYTTPNNTGGQTNTAKERFRIRADGTAHLSPTESNTHLYLGSAGGLTGGNNSINVRAAGNNMMLNSVGQLIVERTGIQKFLVDESYTKVTTNVSDAYTLRVESTGSGDPGLAMWRAGQAGFGIAVRTSTIDYADFSVTNNGLPGYTASGATNTPIRIYQNNNVSMPHSASWSTGIGNTFSSTGNHYMIRSSSSTGNESIIINNTTSPGSIGILQYRENAGVQGQYLIGTNGSGITFTGSSDYRLKENVNTITASSLDRINQLRLITYNWNDLSGMPTDEEQIGVLAHEMEEVFPEFVEGEKDAVYTQEDLDARGDPETTNEEVGDIKAQTVSLLNKDMIVHILKGMQELKAENEALKARIEALEG